jgi:hypothetical protein
VQAEVGERVVISIVNASPQWLPVA